MLQVDPLGLASRWKPGGPFAGSAGEVTSGSAAEDKVLFPGIVLCWLWLFAAMQVLYEMQQYGKEGKQANEDEDD